MKRVEKLGDLARVLRSKNAGPYTLTVDLLFDDEDVYRRVLNVRELRPEALARRLGVSVADKVKVILYPAALAIKITWPRSVSAGSPGDSDVYGAQQHGSLLEIVVTEAD